MKLKILFTSVLVGCFLFSNAQSSRIRYHGMVQAGLIHGVQEPAFLIQTIQGVQYKTWSVGLGAGLDAYYRQSAPLFIDLRKKILNKPNTPFLFADLGGNIPFDKSEKDIYLKTTYSGGKYYDIGVGYQWAMEKNTAFNLSIGYSHKYINSISYYGYIDEPIKEEMNYTLRRLSLKAGLSF
ncbi:MAG: hypothetical protein ACXWC7_19150 [Chitinophagaceae bacterium]